MAAGKNTGEGKLPDGGLFLYGWTALALWQALRCTARPRLDEDETMPHVLARLGLEPARSIPFGRPPSEREPWAAIACALEDTRRLIAADRACDPRKRRDVLDVDGPPTIPVGEPAELLVRSDSSRRSTHTRRCHTWGNKLPLRAFTQLSGNVYLCRPEFAFLQLASNLNEAELVLLGYEMCGFYAIRRPGIAHASRCRPLTTAIGLRRFLDRIDPGVRGLARARRAALRVLDRSASAAETAMVALLCTPRSHGGYGLPFPRMNHRVAVPAKLQELVGSSPLMCDAYWPDARFALEYDGELGHTGSAKKAHDRNRIGRLLSIGIKVESIAREELFDPHRFDKVARRVAHHIGHRLFSRDYGTGWHRKRSELRDTVLGCLFGKDGCEQGP